MDEPGSSLDKENRKIVYKLINHLINDNNTIVIVSYDPEIIKMSSRLIIFDKGSIIKNERYN